MLRFKSVFTSNAFFAMITWFYLFSIDLGKGYVNSEFEIILHDYTYMFALSAIIFFQMYILMGNDLLFSRFTNVSNLILFNFLQIFEKLLLFFLLYFIELIIFISILSSGVSIAQIFSIFIRLSILFISFLYFLIIILSANTYRIKKNIIISVFIWNLLIFITLNSTSNEFISFISPLASIYYVNILSIAKSFIILLMLGIHGVYTIMRKGKRILYEE